MSDDAKNIMGWFGKRKEGVLQGGMRAHALSVLDCVIELGNAVRCMESGDTATVVKVIARLYALEHEADVKEEELCNQMSIGELNPQEREDFLHFVKKTDGIANFSKEAAIHIQLVLDTSAVIPKHIWTMFASAVSDLESEVNSLINAIKILGSGSDGLMECVRGIKEQERRVDEAYMQIMKALMAPELDHRATTLGLRILDALEEAADTCKACGETISILFYAKKL